MDARGLLDIAKRSKQEARRDESVRIGQWLDRTQVPNPYEFTPTMEDPICVVPAAARADFERAFGVHYVGTGITGSGVLRLCDWNWFLDEEEARREAYCRIWQQTEEGRDWLDPSDLENPTFGDLRRCEWRYISVPGESLLLYRVPALDSLFGSHYLWKVVVEKAVAVAMQRETLFNAWRTTKGSPILPEPGNDPKSQDVPAVYSQQWDTCPWTGAAIAGFASWALTERSGIICRWFPSAEEAAAARTDVCVALHGQEVRRKEREELADAQELYYDSHRALRDQQDRKEYRHYRDQLLIQGVDEYDDGDDVEDHEKTVDWFLTQADRTNAKATAIAKALDAERETRFSPWKGQPLELLRTSLVAAMPVCPLCGKQYVTDDVLEDLVVFGEISLHCCGPHGLSADPKRLAEGQTAVPDLVARLERSASRARNCNDEAGRGILFDPVPIFSHFVIELGRVVVGGKTIARFLARWMNMCHWEVVIVSGYHLQTVMQEAGGPPKSCCFEDTFVRREKSLSEWWKKGLDAAVDARQAVWLRLTNHPQHGWGARRRELGKTIALKVDNPSPSGYDPTKTYFCRVVKIPEHSRKSDFELWIVRPDPEASE